MIGQEASPHDSGTETGEAGVAASVGRIVDRLTGLLRDGSDLVRLTIREEIQEVLRRVIALALAGIAVFIGLLFIGNALALYLTRAVGRPGGFLVAGLVFVAAAAVAVLVAGKRTGSRGHR